MSRTPRRTDAPYLPSDRDAAPSVREQNTDSAWAEFEQLQLRHELRFQDTLPISKIFGDEAGFALTEPVEHPFALPAEPDGITDGTPLTVDRVMVLARRHNRVSPKPAEWIQLYEMLPGKRKVQGVWKPPPPAASPHSDMRKRLCLRDHLEWAAEYGVLDTVHDFLAALTEEQWHHMGEQPNAVPDTGRTS